MPQQHYHWLSGIFPLLLALYLYDLPTRWPVAQAAAGLTPIYALQGAGTSSPYDQAWVDSYGIVTGVVADGFYLQDPTGDNDPATSDGIFVYTRLAPTVQQGACVQVTRAFVDEFYEKTELSRLKSVQPSALCTTTAITPVRLPTPRLGEKALTRWEAYEGMLVAFAPFTATVQGPTQHFADGEREMALLDETLHPYIIGGRVFQQDETARESLRYLSNGLGATLPDVDWGQLVHVGPAANATITTTHAILDYNFGKYQLLLWPDAQITALPQSRGAPTLEQTVGATPDDFTLCTYNVHGLGRGSEQYTVPQEYDQQLAKRARTIAESLQGCTIIGLQETGTPEDAERLAALLRDSFALDYAAVALAGPNTASLEFPLTNSLLVRRERVQVLASRLPQSCSPQDYETIVLPGDCPPGAYALFDRPPLVVDLAVSGAWGEPFRLTVIGNHWKSKGGDESINVVRRTAQAQQVAMLVQARLDADPTAHVVVLGDLNDYYQSGPVETLRLGVEPPMLHLYDYLPAQDRYTYIYNGASQVLDHILVTPGLAPFVALVDPVRINANYTAGMADQVANLARSSDHDPVAIQLRPSGRAILGGNLGYPGVKLQLTRITQGASLTTTTDAQGEFRFWDLPPDDYHLTIFAPSYLAPTSVQVTLAQSSTLTAGYHTWSAPKLTQQTTAVGIVTILVGPALLDQTRQQVAQPR